MGGTSAPNLNTRDTFDPRMLNRSLISPTQNFNVFLQGSFDIGAAELYGEFLYSHRDSNQTNYRQLSLDYPCVSNGVGVGTSAERCNGYSPLIPASITNVLSVTNVPFLPSGGTLLYPGPTGVRLFIGFGNDRSEQEVTYWKGTAGIRGDFFFPEWRFDAYVSYALADASYTFESFLTSRVGQTVQVAVPNAGVPAGLIRNGLTCAINNTAPATGCIPAPPITAAVIGGVLPQDWVDYIFRPVTGTSEYNEWIATITIDGPLFQLWDGPVEGAFGLEYRRAEIDDTPPIESQNGDLLNLTSAAITRGSDSVWEAYGEVEIPIFANRRFAREMTLNLSARYTDYDSYGTSYRAPALFEQFQGGTTGFLGQANDPCHLYGTQVTPGTQRFINCNAELNNPAFSQNSGIIVISQGGAAQGLEAETSTNLNYGIILQPTLPRWAGSLSFAIDFYRIQVNNGVQRVGGTNLLALCYDDPLFQQPGTYCDYITRNPANGQLTVSDSYTNVSTEITSGIDYNLRYVRDIGDGTLRVNAIIPSTPSSRSSCCRPACRSTSTASCRRRTSPGRWTRPTRSAAGGLVTPWTGWGR